MKINLNLAGKPLTAKSGQVKSLGGEKRSPVIAPLMDATGKAISTVGRVAADIGQKMYVAEGQRESLQAYTRTCQYQSTRSGLRISPLLLKLMFSVR